MNPELDDVDAKGVVTLHGSVASVAAAAPSAVRPVALHSIGSLVLVALGAVVVLRRR